MGRKEVSFPVGGQDTSIAIQRQPPYTTPLAKNMRPFDVIAGRGRGGTRPGLDRTHYTTLGSGNPTRLLNSINTISTDNFDVINESFGGTSLPSNWTIGQFAALPPVETISSLSYASSTGTTHRGAVASAATVTNFSATNYRVEIFIVPYRGVHGGTYRLHARMDATTPVSTTDGVVAELILAANGTYSGSLKRYVAGVLTTNAFTGGTLSYDMPGWFTIEISNSTTVKCYWRTALLVTQTVAAATGNRFGFSMEGGSTSAHLLVDRVRVQYFRTTKHEISRSRMYASANGIFYRESWLTEFEQVYATATLSSGRRLFSAELNNSLVIADDGVVVYGSDGTIAPTSFTATSISDWASSGVNRYDHSLEVFSGSASGGEIIGTYQITGISGGTLTIVGPAGTSTAGDAVWRVVRNPKVYDVSIGDAVAVGTDGTTDGAGTDFDSATFTDWTTKLTVAPSTTVRYKVEIISGTGVTPGVYDVSARSSGSITLSASAGANASAIVFKVYREALNPIVATAGMVPLGCQIIARHLGRIYLANGHGWFASRVSDVTDWDYGLSADDEGAVAGASAEIGVVGENLVDLCPWHRDKMLFACRSSLWLLSGDPKGGGTLQPVSHTIGLAAQGAWCTGPNNEMYFLSRDGIYATKSDCLGCEPTSISRTKLPPELMDVGNLEADVCMKYDVRDQGVHIFLTYRNQRDGVSHWFLDTQTGGFWPTEIPATMEPTSIHYLASADAEDDAVLFGGRDGVIRRFRDQAETDEGTAIASYVMTGPYRTADEPGMSGRLLSYQVVVPDESGDHTVTLHPGKSALEALVASAKSTMTFSTGTSSTKWPGLEAAMVFIKHTQSGRPISFEFQVMETEQTGPI